MILFEKFENPAAGATYLLIILFCFIYGIHAYHSSPNSDERASIVIALGRHPQLTDETGTPIAFGAYLDSLNYEKYPVSDSRFIKTIRSVIKDNSNGLLYYLLLTACIKLIGLNLFALRVLSILIAAINLILISRLAKLVGVRSHLCFLLILQIAVNPVFYEDAILLRSYMIALTGCLTAAIYLYKICFIESVPGRYYFIYFIGILIALGSHYFTISLLTGMTCFLLWKRWKAWFPEIAMGYLILVLLIAYWIWYIAPTMVHTMIFFHNQFNIISEGTGYSISFENTIRQLLLYSANMFGNISVLKTPGIILKIISGLIICVLAKLLFNNREMKKYQYLFSVTILTLLLYTAQSVLVGNFFNFIPHYLLFFIPFWCIFLYVEIENQLLYISNRHLLRNHPI